MTVLNCSVYNHTMKKQLLPGLLSISWLLLAPMEGNRIDTELRYTQGMAQFPMAGMLLIKVGLEY